MVIVWVSIDVGHGFTIGALHSFGFDLHGGDTIQIALNGNAMQCSLCTQNEKIYLLLTLPHFRLFIAEYVRVGYIHLHIFQLVKLFVHVA